MGTLGGREEHVAVERLAKALPGLYPRPHERVPGRPFAPDGSAGERTRGAQLIAEMVLLASAGTIGAASFEHGGNPLALMVVLTLLAAYVQAVSRSVANATLGVLCFFVALYLRAYEGLAQAVADHYGLGSAELQGLRLALGAYAAVWPCLWLVVTLPIIRRVAVWAQAPLLAAALVAAEWTRSQLPVPMPWVLLAYGFTDSVVLLVAPLGGVWLGSLVPVLLSAWLATALTQSGTLAAAVPPIVLLVVAGAGLGLLAWRTPAAEAGQASDAVTVTAITMAIDDSVLYQPEPLRDGFEQLMQAAGTAGGQVVVFPEGAVPVPWNRLPSSASRRLQDLVDRKAQGQLIVGTYREDEGRAFNTALLARQGATEFRFVDKSQLMPLGEYLPALLRGLTFASTSSASSWRGRDLSAAPWRSARPWPEAPAVLICSDASAPGGAAERIGDAPWVVQLSHLGWFRSAAVFLQELNISRWRAAENRRWLLRVSVPDGAALIDPHGRVVSSADAGARSAEFRIPRTKNRHTPFAVFPHAFPLLAIATICVGACRRAVEGSSEANARSLARSRSKFRHNAGMPVGGPPTA